jgi:hypothetical protein
MQPGRISSGNPAGLPAETGKQPVNGQEFPCGSCLHFLFYGRSSGILKIRQIHNLFIPPCFHWNGPLKGPDWCKELQKILFLLQDIENTAQLYRYYNSCKIRYYWH